MKLFYEALLRSRKMPSVDREGKKRSHYVQKRPKRLHRDTCCTQTQWSKNSYHHLELGTQHLLLLRAGSSADREMCSCWLCMAAKLCVPLLQNCYFQLQCTQASAAHLWDGICKAALLPTNFQMIWPNQSCLFILSDLKGFLSFIHYTQKTAEYLKQLFTTFNMHMNSALKKGS